MKKLLVTAAGLLWAGAAIAGDYHVESTLRCSECHTMHASRTHGLNQEAFEATFFNTGVMAAPNRNLLLSDGTNATCLACHDPTANPASAAIAPDVLGTNSSTLTGAAGTVRSAGALNAAATSGFTAGVGYDHFDGHTLGSDAVPPGFVGTYEPTPQENFNCANCHAVHGSWAFRNLGLSRFMGLPGQSGAVGNPFELVGPSYNIQNVYVDGSPGRRAATAADDVYVGVPERNYETANVVFRQGTGGMNAYCAVCHGYFHGDGNTRDLIGGIDFVRHPTSGVVRDASVVPLLNYPAGGVAAQTNLVRPAWVGTGAPAGTENFEAACLSCHKGHGNLNGYGLIYPDNTGAASNFEDGDAAPAGAVVANDTLRNLCVTCHAQGRDLSDPTAR